MLFLIYLLKVSACLAVFYGLYFFAFRQFTFHTLNRFYLLCTLLLSFIIPLISFETTKVVKVEPAIIVEDASITSSSGYEPAYAPMYDSHAIATVQPIDKTLDWRVYIIFCYIAISSIMMVFLCAKLFKIYQLSRQAIKADNLHIVQRDGQLTNASFFNLIFLNINGLTDNEKSQIIAHECVHIRHLHSIDVLLVEICKIILWFNPIIYFYKKSLVEVHEFEADQNTIQQFDSKNYAHLLLKLGISHNVDLTNQFSLHPLSTRIQFLFKKRTISIKRVLYMLGLPILALGIFAFAQRNEKLIYETAAKASEGISNKVASLSEALKSIEEDSLSNQKGEEPIMAITSVDSSRYKIMVNPFLLKMPEVTYPDYSKNPMLGGGEMILTVSSKNTPGYYAFDFFGNGKYITEGASADSVKLFQNGKELKSGRDFEFIYEKGVITSAIFKEHVRSETVGVIVQITTNRPYTLPEKQEGIPLEMRPTPEFNSPWRYKTRINAQQNFNTDSLRTLMAANFLGKNPLVIINGREYHPKILHSLNYREGYSYIAKANDPYAVDKYGLKAQDGVVDIKTSSSFEFDSERKHQIALQNIKRELLAYELYKNDKIVKVRLLDDDHTEYERVIVKGFIDDRTKILDIPITGKVLYKIDGKVVSEGEVISYAGLFTSANMWINKAGDGNGHYAGVDLRTK